MSNHGKGNSTPVNRETFWRDIFSTAIKENTAKYPSNEPDSLPKQSQKEKPVPKAPQRQICKFYFPSSSGRVASRDSSNVATEESGGDMASREKDNEFDIIEKNEVEVVEKDEDDMVVLAKLRLE